MTCVSVLLPKSMMDLGIQGYDFPVCLRVGPTIEMFFRTILKKVIFNNQRRKLPLGELPAVLEVAPVGPWNFSSQAEPQLCITELVEARLKSFRLPG